jgi:exodeoxyribonuclease VII large subunit
MTDSLNLPIFTVSEFTSKVKNVLESYFPSVWISGEISNLATPRSGHWYFTLKDEDSQVRCAMFRHNNQRLSFRPGEGTQVLVKARVSLYEARGDFQLIVETMEDAGIGALQRAYEQLKNKLQKEGLFDQQYKQEIPQLAKCVGIITSPTGAALHDILHVMERRFPGLPIIIYPAQVQGDDAPAQLINALHQLQEQALCDVVIIGRGGGSIEDLWAFNHEGLARAIYDCPIPVVSSVGHETDFTICDFVADVRAPTPSAAAELVSPDQQEWLNWLLGIESQLARQIKRLLDSLQQKLDWQSKRLKHPGRYLDDIALRIDELSIRIEQQLKLQLQLRQEKMATLEARLHRHSPQTQLDTMANRLDFLNQRLEQSLPSRLNVWQQRLISIARELDAFSPLSTLGRGYSLVKTEDDRLVKSAAALAIGQSIKICFASDQAQVSVEKIASKPCDSD